MLIVSDCKKKGCGHLCLVEKDEASICACRQGYYLQLDGKRCECKDLFLTDRLYHTLAITIAANIETCLIVLWYFVKTSVQCKQTTVLQIYASDSRTQTIWNVQNIHSLISVIYVLLGLPFFLLMLMFPSIINVSCNLLALTTCSEYLHLLLVMLLLYIYIFMLIYYPSFFNSHEAAIYIQFGTVHLGSGCNNWRTLAKNTHITTKYGSR